MIRSREELDEYLRRDREADGITREKPRLIGGGYEKKLWQFKIFLRKAEYWSEKSRHAREDGGGAPARLCAGLIAKYYSVRKNRLGGQLGFSIECGCFGPGLSIPHYGTIVVHSRARIGADCCIQAGVTIGVKKAGAPDAVPVIGDRCAIGTGAKILGPVRVGDDVTIGANAVVVRDIPDHAIAAGVPAKVIGWNDGRK